VRERESEVRNPIERQKQKFCTKKRKEKDVQNSDRNVNDEEREVKAKG